MRLIDADALIEKLESKGKYRDISVVREMPTIEERHGVWSYDRDLSRDWWCVDRFTCSACGRWTSYGRAAYCPHCGAKMDGERKDDGDC